LLIIRLAFYAKDSTLLDIRWAIWNCRST